MQLVPETSFVTYLSCQKKSSFPSEVSLDFVLGIPSARRHHLRDIRRSLEIIEDKASFNVVSFILMDISCEAIPGGIKNFECGDSQSERGVEVESWTTIGYDIVWKDCDD
ncbi:hypothetical protein TNCT_473921 [Trichonephila clavata]|uniref:Uncharacterized protein n=1 Tax=Trichonephila clavata TaxID=2740835 RepID=A0A8X6LLH7_TRICU|nr:hypothetical protein TNCT_473921 [Trichonephila clavata]